MGLIIKCINVHIMLNGPSHITSDYKKDENYRLNMCLETRWKRGLVASNGTSSLLSFLILIFSQRIYFTTIYLLLFIALSVWLTFLVNKDGVSRTTEIIWTLELKVRVFFFISIYLFNPSDISTQLAEVKIEFSNILSVSATFLETWIPFKRE